MTAPNQPNVNRSQTASSAAATESDQNSSSSPLQAGLQGVHQTPASPQTHGSQGASASTAASAASSSSSVLPALRGVGGAAQVQAPATAQAAHSGYGAWVQRSPLGYVQRVDFGNRINVCTEEVLLNLAYLYGRDDLTFVPETFIDQGGVDIFQPLAVALAHEEIAPIAHHPSIQQPFSSFDDPTATAAWFNGLDKDLPYMLTTCLSRYSCHTVSLMYLDNSWYIYDNVHTERDPATGQRMHSPGLVRVFQHNQLTPAGRHFFAGQREANFVPTVYYTPVNEQRLEFLFDFVALRRFYGDQYIAELLDHTTNYVEFISAMHDIRSQRRQ